MKAIKPAAAIALGIVISLIYSSVFNALGVESIAGAVPLWMCIPFAGMLLSIALMPLIRAEWWEENRQWGVLLWSVMFITPYALSYGGFAAAETVTECLANDYLAFIVLLFGLFCVSGNITLEGDLAGSPLVNVGLLLVGTLLASCIGTTGASMLMVRPVIKMNAWRHNKRHLMIFFIFLISNMGGCLTPIGDPPLLMGFMRGIPFFWSLHLFPVLIVNTVILLFIFYKLDMHYYRKDISEGRRPDISRRGALIEIVGTHNILFLLMIVAAVILSGALPGLAPFQNADGTVRAIHLIGEVSLSLPTIIEIVMILLAALLSFRTTPSAVRIANHFTWGAIEEVATLFIGIFITMQPALMILRSAGPELGLTTPLQLFWATGLLSSFLDNTPTYLVFLTTAGALGLAEGISTTVGTIPVNLLTAISCGAVFMGSVTYIGNAPNFMVKTISEENGIRMPSFFGYLLWPACILMPVFLLDSLIFFL